LNIITKKYIDKLVNSIEYKEITIQIKLCYYRCILYYYRRIII